jgi:hypothetical protein
VGIREITASQNERKSYFHARIKNYTYFHKLHPVCNEYISWKSVMT